MMEITWPAPYREPISPAKFAAKVKDCLRDICTPGATKAERIEDIAVATAWTELDYVIAPLRRVA